MKRFQIVRFFNRYISRSHGTKEAIKQIYYPSEEEQVDLLDFENKDILKNSTTDFKQEEENEFSRENLLYSVNRFQSPQLLLKFYLENKTFFGPISIKKLLQKVQIIQFRKRSLVKLEKEEIKNPNSELFLSEEDLRNHPGFLEIEKTIYYNLNLRKWNLSSTVVNIIMTYKSLGGKISPRLLDLLWNVYFVIKLDRRFCKLKS